MDNYAMALEAARKHFLTFDQESLPSLPQVRTTGTAFIFPFLGAVTHVCRQTGHVRFFSPEGKSWDADYSEALTVYDWLCDRKPEAKPAEEYCPVHSLPGVLVRGKGLSMQSRSLNALFDESPQALTAACEALGGKAISLGDVGYRLPLLPGLSLLLKFYHGDEDFPPSMTLLWDKNILNFLKYETLYYAAGCLMGRLREYAQMPK